MALLVTRPTGRSQSLISRKSRRVGSNAVVTILVVLGGSSAEAQFNLRSAEGKSGLLAGTGENLINYDVSESRVGIKWFTSTAVEEITDPYTTFAIDAGVSAHKGKRDLFSGGDVTPGYDVAVTVGHTRERDDALGYHQGFLRFAYDSARRKTVEGAESDVFKIDSLSGHSGGVGVGYNFGFSEDIVWGVSVSAEHHWKSVEGEREKQVCVGELSGVNEDGADVQVVTCSLRFVGPLKHEWVGQVRSDFSWNIRSLGDGAATLGLLAAASVDLAADKKSAVNLSVGPSFHRPGDPDQVVFAVLLEGVDVGNRRGKSPRPTDVLRLRMYVGVPFEWLD